MNETRQNQKSVDTLICVKKVNRFLLPPLMLPLNLWLTAELIFLPCPELWRSTLLAPRKIKSVSFN